MTYSEVFSHIYSFMQSDPRGNYKLMLGTDSQIHETSTLFITGIVIQRIGKGAWACFRKETEPRCMTVLHERISYETTLTEEVASLFTNEHLDKLINVVLPHIYKGASFMVEGHIDIGAGERNKTRTYVNEMMARIESLGFDPKIKPDSIAASSYANKYTK
ncbi:ribonuclease H-like YkuK family protein [Halobacillus shinanisalinarum]|uniref:Ribonuclease H-like YkuK family protein n=1 Tax=Halobacillus shinanisalinarum TaxID=2932258 RepID=A0ABY4H874_9BACI|nr:ribonuclease H-like YkuK family protein [Halobacillus shinanisalinarum]UOQ95747.1 ribonuclease H-like YkuK family protein [Halobacillus shinanisalinarum]